MVFAGTADRGHIGIVLIGGLVFRKPLLKYVLGAAFELDGDGWNKLSVRWALFFFGMAILNELVWRNFSTDFWVAFKVWGNLPLSIAFMLFQIPLIKRHSLEEAAD